MKTAIVWALIFWAVSLKGQVSLNFSHDPISFSDKNEIPHIRKLIEAFKEDSTLNNVKLPHSEFEPYLEAIQNSTVFLTEFKLISQETELNFLDEYEAEFERIDKAPLYCRCHKKDLPLLKMDN